MKIAFIVSTFPSISQTFVLNRIIGLIDRGHDIDIFAVEGEKEREIPAIVKKYGLMGKTTYIPHKIPKILKSLEIALIRIPIGIPIVLKSLNFIKYGHKAFSLKVLATLIHIQQKGSYDIIHCNFGPNGELGAILKDIGVAGHLVVSFHGYDMGSYLQKKKNPMI